MFLLVIVDRSNANHSLSITFFFKGYTVAFAPPWVEHHRNIHNDMADLTAEMSLYERSDVLVEYLTKASSSKLERDKHGLIISPRLWIRWYQEWFAPPSATTLEERLAWLYIDMYERNVIMEKDISLLRVGSDESILVLCLLPLHASFNAHLPLIPLQAGDFPLFS